METTTLLFKINTFLLLLFIGFSLPCSQNCQSCLSSTFCLQCSGYYSLFANGTCSTCQCCVSGCLYCNCPDQNTCSICKEGFTYNATNGCVSNINSLDIKILIGSIIGGIIGVIILICIFVPIIRQHNEIYVQKYQSNALPQIYESRESSNSFKETELIFDKNKDYCTICLENGCNLISNCDHYFHKECFCEWFRIYGNCSVCKNNLIEFILMICLICKKKMKKLSLVELFQLNELQEKCNQTHESL